MTDERELVAERYRLLAPVGRGGMGTVWKARDERLDRVVAVKRLETGTGEAATSEEVRRAVREGRVAARLRHPNAIGVHDVVVHNGKPCLVMEFLPGRGLSEVLAERQRLPVQEVAAIGAQIAAALAEAHGEGIVHRDIKPGNILLTPEGVAKIADFGISRAVGEATVTGDGLVAGTPAYFAPEVADGEAADFASDVFSLGATLYTALEGRLPFGDNDNPMVLLRRISAGKLEPPTTEGPLTEVLLRMLRHEKAARPTMSEARDALSAIAEGEPVSLPPPRTPTLVLSSGRRPSRRAVLGAAGAAALLAAGVAIGVIVAAGGEGEGDPGTTVAGPASSAPAPPEQRCVASYRVTNTWPGGYEAEVTVRNTGAEPLTGWKVGWLPPEGQSVDNLWNGTISRSGAEVEVSNADWNITIEAGSSASFGFTGSSPETGIATPPSVSCSSA
ncbi:protein kinase [Saccharomonospora sp. NPDC006951]